MQENQPRPITEMGGEVKTVLRPISKAECEFSEAEDAGIVSLNPFDDDTSAERPKGWKPPAGVASFKKVGTWYGTIDFVRPFKKITIIERINKKPDQPEYYLLDEGDYPRDYVDGHAKGAPSRMIGRKIVPIELV